MRYTPSKLKTWAVLATLPMALTFSVQGGEGEERVVVHSKIKNCPNIQIGDGEHVQFLDLSERGFLGVEVTALSPELRQHFGVDGDEGVMISRLVEDSAASGAGLRVGDIITRVDGDSIENSWSLGKAIRGKEGGEVVDVEFWRDRRTENVLVTLAAKESCAFDVGSYFEGVDWEQFARFGERVSAEALENVDWEEIGNMGVRISEDALAIALDSLQGVLGEGELERLLEKELEGIEVLDVGRLEDRMEQVQERLERLEEQLERELENVERKQERIEKRRERQVERENERREESRERDQERVEDI